MKPSRDLSIISGIYRGRRFASPADSGTHPMGSREKLALFNMVSVSGCDVLDIYAGSGALGLEALSHGAKSVVFVEKSPKIAQVLRSNLTQILSKIPAGTPIFTESASRFCARNEFKGYFDVILADPPYDGFKKTTGLLEPLASPLEAEITSLGKLLRHNGTLVLSSPAELPAPVLDGFTIEKSHTYARARLTVYNSSL